MPNLSSSVYSHLIIPPPNVKGGHLQPVWAKGFRYRSYSQGKHDHPYLNALAITLPCANSSNSRVVEQVKTSDQGIKATDLLP